MQENGISVHCVDNASKVIVLLLLLSTITFVCIN